MQVEILSKLKSSTMGRDLDLNQRFYENKYID